MTELNLTRDVFTNELQAQRMEALAKYDTRYFFCPFMDVAHQSIPEGYARGGEIVAIDAPRRPIPAWDLPERGAETLGFAKHRDQYGNEIVNKNVVIYLDEPGPVINTLIQWSLVQGGTEITALKGMPGETFTKMNVNDIVFGAPRPKNAEELQEKMRAHVRRAEQDKSDGAQKLADIALQVMESVGRCLGYCDTVLQETHAEMDTAKAGNPEAKKRYDGRDKRALQFSGAVPRDEVLTQMARDQRETQKAIPTILERMAQQEERWARMFEAQTEAMKAIAATVGANNGAQPVGDNQPKAKK